MAFNPGIHHRRSIRMKRYDYSAPGMYFITICTDYRIYRFGEIRNGEMHLNLYGKIARDEWNDLIIRFPNIELHAFVVMPNHFHGVIAIHDPVGETLAVSRNNIPKNDVSKNNISENDVSENDVSEIDVSPNDISQNDVSQNNKRARVNRAPTIGDIVGAYKSLSSRKCLNIFKIKNGNKKMGKLWQRNYYEHIIRNQRSYEMISNYIINNPLKWKTDKFKV